MIKLAASASVLARSTVGTSETSAANLAAAVTDESGSGALVFATSPTLVTPVLGADGEVYAVAQGQLAGGGFAAAGNAETINLLPSPVIPEIDIKIESIPVTAQTRKLRARWSPELAQDLNAYHSMDAEVELTQILSEQIALEIDREILNDLLVEAQGANFFWSRIPGKLSLIHI